MFYSITFGEKNTWDDWHIVPASRPLVNPPAVKTEYVDVPGADGSLDYTEALSGVKYKDREGSWTFYVMNGYQEWHVLYNQILAYLHGRRMRIHLESDPDYYYYGRLFVDEWQSAKDYSTITIRYIIDAYKLPLSSTAESDWLWNDLFNLVIYYGTFDVATSKDRNLINPNDEDIRPTITVTSAMTVEFDGTTYSLAAGTNSNSGIVLSPGDNYMTFHGNGRVVIDYDTGRTL